VPGQAVWLGPSDEVEQLQPWLATVPLIALDFPSFRDGRAYSQAYLLRTRMGGKANCARLGTCCATSSAICVSVDAFAVREDKSGRRSAQGLAGTSVLYGRSVIEPRPLFRRR
jgi:uncharacterized protein (DUF934 family)